MTTALVATYISTFGVQQRVSITVSKIKDSPPKSVPQRIRCDRWYPLPPHRDAATVYIFGLTNGHLEAVDTPTPSMIAGENSQLKQQPAGNLREVLVNGSIVQDLDNEGIRICYEIGWLHSEPLDFKAHNIACGFPTRPLVK
ncbi:hypothetical protein V8E54_014949 [Elaphomyces granulatus]